MCEPNYSLSNNECHLKEFVTIAFSEENVTIVLVIIAVAVLVLCIVKVAMNYRLGIILRAAKIILFCTLDS